MKQVSNNILGNKVLIPTPLPRPAGLALIGCVLQVSLLENSFLDVLRSATMIII